MNRYVKQYSQNTKGQDWFIGDIHGHYEELMDSLKDKGFDFARDRLFAVGDLCDRGLESEKTIQLVEKDWFYSVRGNHDQFILDQYEDERVLLHGKYHKYEPATLHKMIEGKWFFKFDETVRAYLAKLLMPLPYAIELHTHGYKIGISHAGVPVEFDDWNEFIGDLANRNTRELCLRTRNHAKLYQESIERTLLGVDYTVHGHTCFESPVFTTFSAFIDTFDKSGRFTLVKLEDLVMKLDKNKEWREGQVKHQKYTFNQ